MRHVPDAREVPQGRIVVPMADLDLDIDVYADPACLWSHVAVSWLQAAATRRCIRTRVRPLSLVLRDGEAAGPDLLRRRRAASLGACRVLQRIEAVDPAAVGGVWDAVVAQDHGDGFGDLRAALAAAGADPALAAAAGDDRVDLELRRAMRRVEQLVGASPTVPTLVIDGAVAFAGPLLRSVPSPDEAATALDAVVALARTPGFYELSRPRPPHPAHRSLPPTSDPPALPARPRRRQA